MKKPLYLFAIEAPAGVNHLDLGGPRYMITVPVSPGQVIKVGARNGYIVGVSRKLVPEARSNNDTPTT